MTQQNPNPTTEPTRPSPNKKKHPAKPFAIEWRYVGKWNVFPRRREWTVFRRYTTAALRDDNIERCRRTWGEDWEFRARAK